MVDGVVIKVLGRDHLLVCVCVCERERKRERVLEKEVEMLSKPKRLQIRHGT